MTDIHIKLKALLNERFPGMVEQVILFGSRVNNHERIDSDFDILVILHQPFDWKIERAIQDVCWEIDYKYEVVTDVKIYSKHDLTTIRGKQPFVLNALNNGLVA